MVGQALNRGLDLRVNQREELLHQPLDDSKQNVALGERHLNIHLRELGLAVSTKVLVPETAYDLKVAVETADHQQLLEQLRGLGQRVKMARMDAAGHQEVARAFRRGAGHKRRFDFNEAMPTHMLAHNQRYLVTQPHMVLHPARAQIEIAVAQASFLGHLRFVGDGEGRGLSLVQQKQILRSDLHLSGRDLLVHRVSRPCDHLTFHADDVLRTDEISLVVRFRAHGGITHHLDNTGVIAEVEEDEIAEIATAVDPARQKNGLAGVLVAELAAVMCSLPVT